MTRTRLVCALALCLLTVACGSDDDDGATTATTIAAAVTGEFVGTASGQDAYVAIAASNPASGEFDVVAYLCNRQVPLAGSVELAEWFTGTGTANAVDLESESGTSRLRATFAADRPRGRSTCLTDRR